MNSGICICGEELHTENVVGLKPMPKFALFALKTSEVRIFLKQNMI